MTPQAQPKLPESPGDQSVPQSILARRYLRTIVPGVLAGFTGSIFEIPSFAMVGLKSPTLWWHVVIGFLTTMTCFCTLGVVLGLVFEGIFHLLLGADPPPTLADGSDDAKRKRRSTAAHLLAGILCVLAASQVLLKLRPHTANLFSNQFPAMAALVIPAIVPVAFLHVALSRWFLRALGKLRNLRHVALVGGPGLLVFSWFVSYHLLAGLQSVLRIVLSAEAMLLVFAFVWLRPSQRLTRYGLVLGGLAFLTSVGLGLYGLSQPIRAVLVNTDGKVQSMALRLPIFRTDPQLARLQEAIEAALARQRLASGTHAAGRRHEHIVSDGRGERKPDIILITVDSLRADRLGSYGAGTGITPHLDRFAEQARVFLNAFATASSTLPSLSQMMSGRLEHEMHFLSLPDGPLVMAADSPNLAAVLRSVGYETRIMTGTRIGYVSRFLGQGFARIEDAEAEGSPLSARSMLGRVLGAFAEQTSQPLFCWTHLMEVHDRWRHEAARDPGIYHRRVAGVDRDIGEFLSALARTERGRNAMVIITADHGESLGEQERFFHSSMAPVTLRVPLMIRLPGHSPARIESTVSHLDLAPTILTGIGLRGSELPGVDLLSVPAAPAPAAWPSHLAPHELLVVSSRISLMEAGVTAFPWQLLYGHRNHTLALYDLAHDASGEDNLAGRGRPEERVLLDLLIGLYEGTSLGNRIGISSSPEPAR